MAKRKMSLVQPLWVIEAKKSQRALEAEGPEIEPAVKADETPVESNSASAEAPTPVAEPADAALLKDDGVAAGLLVAVAEAPDNEDNVKAEQVVETLPVPEGPEPFYFGRLFKIEDRGQNYLTGHQFYGFYRNSAGVWQVVLDIVHLDSKVTLETLQQLAAAREQVTDERGAKTELEGTLIQVVGASHNRVRRVFQIVRERGKDDVFVPLWNEKNHLASNKHPLVGYSAAANVPPQDPINWWRCTPEGMRTLPKEFHTLRLPDGVVLNHPRFIAGGVAGREAKAVAWAAEQAKKREAAEAERVRQQAHDGQSMQEPARERGTGSRRETGYVKGAEGAYHRQQRGR